MSDKPIIDISKFNTIRSWSAVANNVKGVIIRLGFTGYGSGTPSLDPKFSDHIRGCKNNNIPYGIYYFPQSINISEATKEAAWILDKIREYDLSLSYPIYLDSEIAETKNKSGRADKLDKNTRTILLNKICEILHNAGYDSGVYASKSWFENNLIDTSLYTYVYKWVAQYNSNCTYKGLYQLWQYTSKGIVTGIEGNVDLSKQVGVLPGDNTPDPIPEPTPEPEPIPEPVPEPDVVRLATTVDINIYDQFGERLTGWTLQTNCY